VLGKIVLAGLTIGLLASGPMQSLPSHESSDGSIAWALEDGNRGPYPDAVKDDASDLDAGSSPPNVAGTWIGNTIDMRYGRLGFDLQISQRRHHLNGFWSFFLGLGRFTGQINGDGFTVLLKHRGNEGRGCTIHLSVILVSDTEMTGTYSIGKCNPADAGMGAGGTVDFTRE
jgi:hypothetical protein